MRSSVVVSVSSFGLRANVRSGASPSGCSSPDEAAWVGSIRLTDHHQADDVEIGQRVADELPNISSGIR